MKRGKKGKRVGSWEGASFTTKRRDKEERRRGEKDREREREEEREEEEEVGRRLLQRFLC